MAFNDCEVCKAYVIFLCNQLSDELFERDATFILYEPYTYSRRQILVTFDIWDQPFRLLCYVLNNNHFCIYCASGFSLLLSQLTFYAVERSLPENVMDLFELIAPEHWPDYRDAAFMRRRLLRLLGFNN